MSIMLHLTRRLIWLPAAVLLGLATIAHTEPKPPSQQPEVILQVGHSEGMKFTVFAPDGHRVFTGGGTSVKVWSATNGRLMHSYTGFTGDVSAIALLPTGGMIASSVKDTTIRLWDVPRGRLLQTLQLSDNIDIRATAFSPDGRRIVSTGLSGKHQGTVVAWEVATGRRLQVSSTGDPVPVTVAFSPDGKIFVTGDDTGGLKIWNATTLTSNKTIMAHKGRVGSITFAPDGRTFASSGNDDGWTKIRDVATGRELSSFVGALTPVAFSPDGRTLFSGSYSGLALWDVASGSVRREETGNHPSALAFSPDGRNVAFDNHGALGLWSVADRRNMASGTNPPQVGVEALAMSASGSYLASAQGNELKLWEPTTGALLRSFKGHNGSVQAALAFSPNGRMIVSGAGDEKLKIWDTETGRISKEFPETSYRGGSVGFFPDGRIFSTNYSYVTLWDSVEARLIRVLQVPNTSAALSPDARTLVSTGLERVVVTDVASGKLLHDIAPGHVETVNVVVFAPDGRSFASGADFGNIQLWETQSGRALRKFDGKGPIGALAFSPDSKVLASASNDSTVRLWDVASGRLLRTLDGHSGPVRGIVFAPDGRTLISGSADATIRRWTVAGDLVATSVVGPGDEWVTITPEGFFAASSTGANLLNVVRGIDVLSVDQYRDALFRPDLVREKLAGDPNGVVKAAATRVDLGKVADSGSAPKVAITLPVDGASMAKGEVSFEATIADQGGGIGRIEWRLNGQAVGIETRGLSRVPNDAAAKPAPEAIIKVTQKMLLDAGDNSIEMLAYNSIGLAASQPARIKINATGPVVSARPRLFVLAVGVNDYFDGRLKLNFAAPDARSIAASFQKAGTGFYESVKAVTVLDADVTRANLEKAFKALAGEVKTSDVFVFFIAGHGRTLDGHYYFLPQDFRYRDQSSFAEGALSQEQWQKWFTLVQARKSILIYDTCESGAVTAENIVMASNSRGLQRLEEQAVAYDKLRDATGKTILAASTEKDPALEGYRGHGVFSYVLMEALEKAQTNSRGQIEVTGLISYIDERVPEVSFAAFHQRQIPQNKMLGSNFAIAKPTAMLLGTGSGNTAPVVNSALADPVPMKPTHVVITSAEVFEAAGKGTKSSALPPGTLLSLIKSENGWILVAKDGKALGYISESQVARVQ